MSHPESHRDPHPHLAPRHDIARTVFIVLLIGLLIGGCIWIIKPFLPAIVWATMIVVATWPMMRRAQAWLGNRRWAATTLMTSALAALVIVPVGVAVGTIAANVLGLKDEAAALLSHPLPAAPGWLHGVPILGPRLTHEWQALVAAGPGALVTQLQPYAGKLASWIAARAGGLGMLTLHLLLTIFVAALLYMRGEEAAQGLRRFARRVGGQRGDKAVILAGQAIRAVAMGIVVTALVQSGLGGVGLAIGGVPYVLVLTSIMFICCIAQIGAGVVLFGAAAWLFFHEDRTGMAVFMAVWALVVTSLDNVLRPMLIKRGADLPLTLIFGGVLGGLVAFGIVGLFIGPVVLAVSFTLLKDWIDHPIDGSPADTPAQPAAPTIPY
ncbi:AI-2E family transporter YdiK [Aquabacterium sp.]|uniref:AI-2E family transporter YdiK n=1 Tax=Aquabacterium sp. TaxID=1872578 RepID=UPI0035B01668